MKSNINTRKLVAELRKTKTPAWKRIADELEKSTKRMPKVNIHKINKYTRDKEIAVIPGKVLGVGNLDKKLTVAAFQFSESAREKINKSGKALSLSEILKQNPKAEKVRILK